MPMRVTDRFVSGLSRGRGGWQIRDSENSKRRGEGSEEAERGNSSSLRGGRVMERDVSGAFFQSICPASRPSQRGGPNKKRGHCGTDSGFDRVQKS